jgi:hypothetical protein
LKDTNEVEKLVAHGLPTHMRADLWVRMIGNDLQVLLLLLLLLLFIIIILLFLLLLIYMVLCGMWFVLNCVRQIHEDAFNFCVELAENLESKKRAKRLKQQEAVAKNHKQQQHQHHEQQRVEAKDMLCAGDDAGEGGGGSSGVFKGGDEEEEDVDGKLSGNAQCADDADDAGKVGNGATDTTTNDVVIRGDLDGGVDGGVDGDESVSVSVSGVIKMTGEMRVHEADGGSSGGGGNEDEDEDEDFMTNGNGLGMGKTESLVLIEWDLPRTFPTLSFFHDGAYIILYMLSV